MDDGPGPPGFEEMRYIMRHESSPGLTNILPANGLRGQAQALRGRLPVRQRGSKWIDAPYRSSKNPDSVSKRSKTAFFNPVLFS